MQEPHQEANRVNADRMSDEQLMLMFQYGNHAAFTLLFERYRVPIYNFARRMLNEQTAAEDALQETFLRAVGAADTYEPTAKFRTWLFTVARNCCLNSLRKRPMMPLIAEGLIESAAFPDPQAAASQADLLWRVEAAIAHLPIAWREAFLLRYRHGMDYGEIAEVTKLPLGTIKTHIHRARLRLAGEMQRLLGEDYEV
jgi:RNA polymerase sigma-70 factor (ECF subfamily)